MTEDNRGTSRINDLEDKIVEKTTSEQNKEETFNKDVEELKRNQATMKNTINEIKNTLDR